MPRISQLQSLSAADNADELAIVDVSAASTKKITRGDLLKAPLPANSVTTAAISNGAVTSDKIDFATLAIGNYSTAEVLTSYKWIDGKPIYKKTVELGALPNSSVKNVAHGVVSLDKFISISGVGVSSSNCIDLTQGNGVYIYTSLTNVTVNTSIARSTFNGFATLLYTKS